MRQSKTPVPFTMENTDQFLWDQSRQIRRNSLLLILNRDSGMHSMTGYQFTAETQARFARLATLAKQTCSSLALRSPLNEKTVFKEIGERCAPEIAELNRIIGTVKLVPMIKLATRGRDLEMSYEPHVSRFDEKPEAFAILGLCDLVDADEIDRLRRCKVCPTWFIAGREDRKTCSPKCRQKLLSSTPQFKKKRKRYLKDRNAGKFIVQPRTQPKKRERSNG
jgi:hypothetical protein